MAARNGRRGIPVARLPLRLPYHPVRNGAWSPVRNEAWARTDAWTKHATQPTFGAVPRRYGSEVPGARNAFTFIRVRCAEHGCDELVPEGNIRDLRFWYAIGRHPRFPVIKTLLDKKQRTSEILGSNRMRLILDVLRRSKDKQDFLRRMRRHLFHTIYAGGNRYRVTRRFLERYRHKTFTVRDFLRTENQELRRLILRRGVSIQGVLKELIRVETDDEGSLYDWVNGTRRQRFLYVKCPSTNQEYLLGVPRRCATPSGARRWTLDVPGNTVFAQET